MYTAGICYIHMGTRHDYCLCIILCACVLRDTSDVSIFGSKNLPTVLHASGAAIPPVPPPPQGLPGAK